MPREKLTPERRRQITRDALIDSAAEAFAEKGYRGASLAEIAAAAGFTSGAIYSNFADKEELLFAVLDRYLDRLAESQAMALERIRRGEELGEHDDGPAAAAADLIDWALANREFVLLRMELLLHAMRNSKFAERFRSFLEEEAQRAARQFLEQAERNGFRPTVPVTDLAAITNAAATAFSQHVLLDPENAAYYTALLTYVFRLPRGYYEAFPGDS